VEPVNVSVSTWRRTRSARPRRGVVLFVALIAVVALSLCAVGLLRAVSTEAAVTSNLALREQATLAASVAIEEAVAALFETGAIADRTSDAPAQRYFASRQPDEDGRGVPHALLDSTGDAEPPPIDAGDGFLARHVIERSCGAAGPASIDRCTLSPPALPGGSEPELPRTPYYRVTVRVDGPGGSLSFIQALLGEEPSRHRLSWRVLDEAS
jgi:type IV pilus assembly protein PilX